MVKMVLDLKLTSICKHISQLYKFGREKVIFSTIFLMNDFCKVGKTQSPPRRRPYLIRSKSFYLKFFEALRSCNLALNRDVLWFVAIKRNKSLRSRSNKMHFMRQIKKIFIKSTHGFCHV